MKKNLFFLIFLLYTFNLSSIEVSGHLTEDTIWTPDNNPYIVIDNIYVDEGVTLTILPGTEIKITAASCTSWQELDQSFWYQNGTNVAKMFWVDGRIIAEGNEQNRIIFTRLQDDPDYSWGTMYFTENAELSIFKYCDFSYSAVIRIYVSRVAKGPLSLFNGKGIVRNCNFINNCVGVSSEWDTKELEIIDNNFVLNGGINTFMYDMWSVHIQSYRMNNNDYPFVLIANNTFIGNNYYQAVYAEDLFFSFNKVNNCQGVRSYGHYFSNEFNNCDQGIENTTSDPGSLYINNNNFIGGTDGINIDDAYVEISDNYFEGCDVYTEYATGKIYNNISNNGEIWTPGELEIYNNICYNNNEYGLKVGYNPYCVNNISINNTYDIWSATVSYENCIIILNEELTQHIINGNPVFRNCIIDFELEYPLINGGGNIWVDSLQAQTLFEDIQNGDFHLIEGSLAIDAGFDTLSYYYPFDMDYNHRVWDGDGNGSAIIDIGPYEYNSPAFGGIEGYTYNPTTGEPVDYVLLKIDNQPGEFTFSDSLGSFEYKLPDGVYDVYAERVFYDDVVVYQIEVVSGQFTQLNIPMSETVDVEDYEIPKSEFIISNLSNYPNPFNPSTSISFSLTTEFTESTELIIYNLKGQKVKTLECGESLSTTADGVGYSISWNGTDSNNKAVSSGIYFYKLKAGKSSAMKKMLILK